MNALIQENVFCIFLPMIWSATSDGVKMTSKKKDLYCIYEDIMNVLHAYILDLQIERI